MYIEGAQKWHRQKEMTTSDYTTSAS